MAATLLQPSKPGPIGSWGEVVLRNLLLRRMVKLVIDGHSQRSIAKELGVARTTVARLARELPQFSNPTEVLRRYYLGLHDRAIDPTHDDVATEADIDNERSPATHHLVARAAER